MLLQQVHPARAVTHEFAEAATRGLSFKRLFRMLVLTKHWMIATRKTDAGFAVPLVRAPIDSSSWENAFNSDEERAEKSLSNSVPPKLAAMISEMGWGVWWVLRRIIF
jgi:hypothetical protein